MNDSSQGKLSNGIFLKKVGAFHKKAWTKICPLVKTSEIIMSLLLCVRERLILSAIFLTFPFFASAQTSTAVPQGNEANLIGGLPGDQVFPDLSLSPNGGYLVWEENGSVKTGSEIKASKLDSNLNRVSTILVNKVAKGDQRNPKVQLLTNDNAMFVWQGNGLSTSDIYARILKADGKFLTSDIRVNTYTKDQQSEPVLVRLGSGGALVVWQSYGQDGSMMGIYARTITDAGKLGSEVQLNQTTDYNQRSPSVVTLKNGNLVVAWVSEFERFGTATDPYSPMSLDVYARILDPAGNPISDEILLNAANNFCANPALAALANGGFTAVWSEKDLASRSNSWEIVGRSFADDGVAVGSDFKINTYTYGDQYRPKITAVGNDCVVVWTSLGQDGSREGVYGRILQAGTQPVGSEFRVNNTTVSQQIYPAIASNNSDRFLVSWSTFVAINGFDLFGRKYTLNQQP